MELEFLLDKSHRSNRSSQELPNPITISKQNLSAYYCKKHRKGKIVTILKGFNCSDEQIKDLAKDLKKTLGIGGSVKNGEIIFQGNCISKLISILNKQGHNVKNLGK